MCFRTQRGMKNDIHLSDQPSEKTAEAIEETFSASEAETIEIL
jgi:hypothetical protein